MVCDILAGERVPPYKKMFTYVPGSRVPGSLKFAPYFPENFSVISSKGARHFFTNLSDSKHCLGFEINAVVELGHSVK